jgi:hypothetical protein
MRYHRHHSRFRGFRPFRVLFVLIGLGLLTGFISVNGATIDIDDASFGIPVISASDNTKKEVRTNAKDFTKVALDGSADVYLRQGDKDEVIVEADEDILGDLVTEVRGGMLKVRLKGSHWNVKTLKVWVTIKSLEAVSSHGSGDIRGTGTFKGKGLDVSIAGSSDVILDVDYDDLEVSIAGSGDAKLSGKANKSSYSIAGSGDVSAFDLKSTSVSVSIAGSGDAAVFASKSLDASVMGSGTVRYKGQPSNVDKSVMGSGEVVSVK